jgi:RNA polymerase sigma-70 factor (ECF subfamily)
MEPVGRPLEPVEATAGMRHAAVEVFVTTAWADHHAEVYAFLVRTTRDPGVAEDLVQEAFLRLTREVRSGRPPTNVRAWLYRVASNLAVSRGRRLSAALRVLVRMGGQAGADDANDVPEAGYLRREGRAELMTAVERLSADARAALLLSSEGFSGAEIAAAIGRSELATRALLCRARIKVRQHLESAEQGR